MVVEPPEWRHPVHQAIEQSATAMAELVDIEGTQLSGIIVMSVEGEIQIARH